MNPKPKLFCHFCAGIDAWIIGGSSGQICFVKTGKMETGGNHLLFTL